jgi:23S rRNA pseudouridine1911/1915/1917 synthase
VEIVVHIPPPEPTDLRPEAMAIPILYQDGDLAVIDKPAGVVVHPSAGHRSGTLVHGLLAAFPDLSGISGEERPGIVHRLDKETSGVILIAKNDRAHVEISRQFKAREVEKRYAAIVEGVPRPPRGAVEGSIGRHPRHRTKFAVRTTRGKVARTGYEVAESFRGFAHLALRPETGRTHQIRVHLAYLGHPVLCDGMYGRRSRIHRTEIEGKRRTKGEEPILARHALHAERLAFRHPGTGDRVEFSAPMPEDMIRVLQAMRLHRSD